MKKVTLFVFCIFFFGLAKAQKNIAGTWAGKLNVSAVSLRMIVHIDGGPGAYTATLDSPDQGAKGISVSRVAVKDDSLILEVAAAGAKLVGQLTSDTTFSGQWVQGGASLPLELKKLQAGEAVAELRRPQTPKPPYPYASEDVVYSNKDKSIQYGATITKPTGNGPFPALLLLTGSGQQNRDEEVFGHKPFAVIADYLTKQGYVVMRVDDRGVGQTTGDVKTATTKDFADDAMVGLNYLKSLPGVDKTKLGLLGHSEGGMMAEIMAAQRKDIAFVILLAAPGEPALDLMTEQNKAILASQGLSSETIAGYVNLYKPLAATFAFAPTETTAKKAATKVVVDWLKKTPKVVADTIGVKDEKSREQFIAEFEKGIGSPWYKYFLRYNPAPYLQKTTAKVLALNGDKDIQVLSKSNLPAMKASLQKSFSKKYDVVELPGLNHLFQHCTKCTVAEYGELEETIAPIVLETISSWLNKNVK